MRYPVLFFLLIFIIPLTAYPQGKDSIRISGVVVSADSLKQLPGVRLQRSGLPLQYEADTAGFFSLYVFPADTITFTTLGYGTAQFLVPDSLKGSSYSLVEALYSDNTVAESPAFYTLPSADRFASYFMDGNLGYDEKYAQMQRNIQRVDNMEDEEAFLSKYQPADVNFGYGRLYNNRYAPVPSNNFLNPVRWADFIQDLRRMNLSDDSN